MKGQGVLRDHRVETALQRLRERVEVRVSGGREDFQQRGARCGHRQRVAVECAHLSHSLVLDHGHDVRAATHSAARKSAAYRLGERNQVRRHPESLAGAARRDRDAGLDLVEDQQRAVLVGERAQRPQVALVGKHDAHVHHRGLDDDRRHLAAMLLESLLRRRQVVERDDRRELDDGARYAFALRERRGRVRGSHLVRGRLDRHHQRVVMAVVAGFDLQDPLPSREPARDANRVKSRLGAGVGEAPLRLLESARQLARHHHTVLHGLREMRAAIYLLGDRVGDLRVGVADHHDAEAVVEVDVLVAVDVPNATALTVIRKHRLRRRVLER